MAKRFYSSRSTHHMCLCIEGALSSKRKITYMQTNEGFPLSDAQARFELKKLRNNGDKVMMIGDCYRADLSGKGCLGHIKCLMPTEYVMNEIELEYALFKQGKRL